MNARAADPPEHQADNPFADRDRFDEVLDVVLERAAEERERTFWARTYAPDTTRVAALRRDEPATRFDELAEGYKALFRDYGSPREHASVLDQIELLARQLARIGASTAAGGQSAATRKRMRAQSTRLGNPLKQLGRPAP